MKKGLLAIHLVQIIVLTIELPLVLSRPQPLNDPNIGPFPLIRSYLCPPFSSNVRELPLTATFNAPFPYQPQDEMASYNPFTGYHIWIVPLYCFTIELSSELFGIHYHTYGCQVSVIMD